MMLIIGLAFAGEVCTTYGAPEETVQVNSGFPNIQASGLAAARLEDDLYYTHDDNKGDAALYVVRGDGTFVIEQTVTGATNEDWEDIASGPCPASVDAEHCLWIADIGDNDQIRTSVDAWVVRESTAAEEPAVRCPLLYPEGRSHDAEAMFITPDGTLRIVTKDNDHAKVFRLSDPQCDGGEPQLLTEEAEIFLEEPVTGAAMSPDGASVVLRGLTKAWLWTGCALKWNGDYVDVDLGVQPQGEAVAYANDGSLVSTSEIIDTEPVRLWRTPCAETAPLECADCGCGGEAAFLLLLPIGAWTRRRRG
ncbi:MAG: hypothetical protein V4850_13845 [Myxococcota bacterium]